MEHSEFGPLGVDVPLRKRSPVQRVIAWGAIVLLSFVLFLEMTSRSQYEATLNNLEAALSVRDDEGKIVGVPSAEVLKHVKGFALRSEETFEADGVAADGKFPMETKRRLVFRWMSLFKTYRLGLTLDNLEYAIFVETLNPSAGS
jgi:hypothetical protein